MPNIYPSPHPVGCKNLTWIGLLDYMQEFWLPHFPLIVELPRISVDR
jgi:hypothetical protein